MTEQTTPTPPQDENHIIAERREKLKAWREAGQAYPNDFIRENLAERKVGHRCRVKEGVHFSAGK